MKTTNSLQELRHILHQHPELSGEEHVTAQNIIHFLQETQPDQVITDVGGRGVVAVYDSKNPGPNLVFRAELDALPITETNTFSHRSTLPDVAHSCGHDGHMTILIGLAKELRAHQLPSYGKIILLFQPAEETAEGAKQVIEDSRFHDLEPTAIFALHNLPGYPLGEIIVKDDIFSMASIGVILKLHGESSHAGHPEQGRSPLPVFLNLLQYLPQLPSIRMNDKDCMVTIIHAVLGDVAFGTSPGDAVVMATIRAETDALLFHLQNHIKEYASTLCEKYTIDCSFEFVEHFPAVINDSQCNKNIIDAARHQKLSINIRTKPFRWTEDFSFFTQRYPGSLFGFGAGMDHPPLHSSSYDFPDKLLDKGVRLFMELIHHYQKPKKSEGS